MRKGTARRVRLAAAVGLLGMTTMAGCGEEPVGSTCEKFGSMKIQDGRYVVQNNAWGTDTQQCISVTTSGFSITSGSMNKPTNGAPASYPSIFMGCHYTNCSAGTPFPAQLSSLPPVSSTVNVTTAPGQWDAAYDIWFDPTPRTDGQNTGAEIMVWVNHQGAPQPVGAKQGTATIGGATWDVWFGNIGWNVISYVRQQPATAFDGSLTAFANDAVGRGHVQRSWYLTSVQFGFEPWTGGPGLGASGFSVNVG
jgi:hypothetical protein